MGYHDRHVVVTGGTGALGTAMVGALIEAGAICHVPYINPAEADHFALRGHARVKLVADIELTNEDAVARLYAGVPKLWASIHIAGGFAMAPIGHLSKQLVWCASRIIEIDEESELPVIMFEGSCSWQDRMLASLAEAGIGWRVGGRASTFAALISALRAGLGIGLLLQEGLPSDCQNLQGSFNLPPAPTADFGIYVIKRPPLLVEELGAFLRAGFEI